MGLSRRTLERKMLFSLMCLMLIVQGAKAQIGIDVVETRVVEEGSQLTFKMGLKLDQVELRTNDLLVITPVLGSNGDVESTEGLLSVKQVMKLPPIVLSGAKRQMMMRRSKALHHPLPCEGAPFYEGRRINNQPLNILYSHTVPYEPWMKDAHIDFLASLTGCAGCGKVEEQRRLIDRVIREPYEAKYKLTYVSPEVEPIKVRSDVFTAQLIFRSGSDIINRDLGNNAAILDEADRRLSEVNDDPDLKITRLDFVGFASPEGSRESNYRLSERRANAFANYLTRQLHLDRSIISVRGDGEDWAGVRQLVEDSPHLQDRSALLSIIDSTRDMDARDAEIKRLSGGVTYQILLKDIYPQVRRTVYTVAYEVRPFDVQEARQVIKRNPKLLSLNEIYLVAISYEMGSDEFKEVFDIAGRLYPDQPVAVNNSAAVDIESGAYQRGVDRLAAIEREEPYVWNNMGVAYAMMGEYDKAEECFIKSATDDALYNLEELTKKRESESIAGLINE